MAPKLTKAKYLANYRISVCFEDGTEGVIDLEKELWGEVFEPLKDLSIFRDFRVDLELQAIVWSTGAGLAPEFLYQHTAA